MSTPEQKRVAQAESAITRLADAVMKAKSQWLSDQMSAILPPEIHALVVKDNGRDRMKLARYVAAHGIRIEEHLDKTCLVVGGKVVSEFVFDGKAAKFRNPEFHNVPIPEPDQN